MIEEIELSYEIDDPNSENWIKIAVALNGIIRKVNVLSKMTDRRYATNAHTKVLQEKVDPNTRI